MRAPPFAVRALAGAALLCALAAGCGDSDDTDGSCTAPAGEPVLDAYGGDSRVLLAPASGWFRTQKVCNRWWLVTPDGHPFYSIGVNSLRYGGSAGQTSGVDAYRETLDSIYESQEAFALVAADRLRQWGFNTAGSWSHHALFADLLPFTINLHLSGGDWQSGEVADWFDPAWTDSIGTIITNDVLPWVEEPRLLGYYLDNEMRWGPDHRGRETLLQLYLQLPSDAPGKAIAVDLLLDELGDVSGVNGALGTEFQTRDDLLAEVDDWRALDDGESAEADRVTTAFLELAAEHYFSTTTAAIRAADPNHMIIGNREVSVSTRVEIYLAAAPHVDVLSINNYVFTYGVGNAALTLSGGLDPANYFTLLHGLVDLPMLITEFGFRALDSGLPNSWPPIYPVWSYQEDRAREFAFYARGAHQTPWLVGYHWFAWADQPAEGRFDGEDNNWGLVNEQDEPYTVVTDEMAVVNPEIWDLLREPPDAD